jgi:hypothetical protein
VTVINEHGGDGGRHWDHGDCFGPRDYYREEWGDRWWDHPHGFYAADSFFLGFELGALATNNYYTNPVYVVDPCTGDNWGTITPPNGAPTFDSKLDAQLAVLQRMDNPPNSADPTAGLYTTDPDNKFDPDNPGLKVSPEAAYNLLHHNDGHDDLDSRPALYFHPASNDGTPRPFEKLQTTDDLQIYIASKEEKPAGT